MIRILFQGDSITDMSRSRENHTMLGSGYPTVVAGILGAEDPAKYQFLNRGIGGNRVVDLYARMKIDLLNLQPDVLSVLIGVNDVWHELDLSNGVAPDKFEKVYSMLVEETLTQRPDMKILILEPFLLEGSATRRYYERFRAEVEERAARSLAVAKRFSLPFVPLQKAFDEAAKNCQEGTLLADGVHPTAIGHGLIAKEWIAAFRKLQL